jgi:pimeloyl-ACP methyl ester carboxylesterase
LKPQPLFEYPLSHPHRRSPALPPAAAMRLVEQHKVLGLVLVAAYDDDLGDAGERDSGYFSRPWDWANIRRNAGFISACPLLHSNRDVRDFGWEIAHTAVSRRPISLYTMVPRTKGYTYAAEVWSSLTLRFATFASLLGACELLAHPLTPARASHAAQFAGTQDSLVPIEIQRRVADSLQCEFIEDPGGDHFFSPPFPQLISVIDANVAKCLAAER